MRRGSRQDAESPPSFELHRAFTHTRLQVTPTMPRLGWSSERMLRIASDLNLKLSADQERLLRAIGEARRLLVAWAPGSGQSASYRVSAQLLSQPTVVLAPHPAQLAHQVRRLAGRGAPMVRVDSGDDPRDYRRALDRIRFGGSLLVLTTADMLARSDVQTALAEAGIGLVVICDAQCLSEHSPEFLPRYSQLDETLDRLGSPPVVALAGACNAEVSRDLIDALDLDPKPLLGDAVRSSVELDVVRGDLRTRQEALVNSLRQLPRPGIVYCSTPAEVDLVHHALSGLGMRAHRYHQRMDPAQRLAEQEAFSATPRRSVLVTTSAFSGIEPLLPASKNRADRLASGWGRGARLPDIRFAIHFQSAFSLEQYARDLSLLGRDGRSCSATLMVDPSAETQQQLAEQLKAARPSPDGVRALLAALARHGAQPVQLERLSVSLDLHRSAAIQLSAVLEDAGLIATSRGWLRALDAELLEERGELLAEQLETLHSGDRQRLREVVAYSEHSGCLRQALLRHFDGRDRSICGVCGGCRSRARSQPTTASWQVPSTTRRREPARSFNVDPQSDANRRSGQGGGYQPPPTRTAERYGRGSNGAAPLTAKLLDFTR